MHSTISLFQEWPVLKKNTMPTLKCFSLPLWQDRAWFGFKPPNHYLSAGQTKTQHFLVSKLCMCLSSLFIFLQELSLRSGSTPLFKRLRQAVLTRRPVLRHRKSFTSFHPSYFWRSQPCLSSLGLWLGEQTLLHLKYDKKHRHGWDVNLASCHKKSNPCCPTSTFWTWSTPSHSVQLGFY